MATTTFKFGQCGLNALALQELLQKMKLDVRLVYGTLFFEPAGLPLYKDQGSIGTTIPGHWWVQTKDGRIGDIVFEKNLLLRGPVGDAYLQKFPRYAQMDCKFRVLHAAEWRSRYGLKHIKSKSKRQKRAKKSLDRLASKR